MIQRLISLIRKEFIQIVRDPRTLVLTLIYPVAMLFLLGFAITNDVRNIPLAVLDRDHIQPITRTAGCLPHLRLFHAGLLRHQRR